MEKNVNESAISPQLRSVGKALYPQLAACHHQLDLAMDELAALTKECNRFDQAVANLGRVMERV